MRICRNIICIAENGGALSAMHTFPQHVFQQSNSHFLKQMLHFLQQNYGCQITLSALCVTCSTTCVTVSKSSKICITFSTTVMILCICPTQITSCTMWITCSSVSIQRIERMHEMHCTFHNTDCIFLHHQHCHSYVSAIQIQMQMQMQPPSSQGPTQINCGLFSTTEGENQQN